MTDTKWERWGLHGGLLGVALLLAAFLTMGAPPDADAPAAEVAESFADNDSSIQLGSLLIAVAVIGLAWWFGSLWRFMRRAEGGEPRLSIIALVGIVLSGGAAMAAAAVNSAVASRIDELSEGTTALGFAATNNLYGMSAVGDVILIAAVSALAIRTGFLPGWLAYGGALIALVTLVATITVATENAAISIIALVAFLAWLAWIAAVSLVLYERKTSTTIDMTSDGPVPQAETAV